MLVHLDYLKVPAEKSRKYQINLPLKFDAQGKNNKDIKGGLVTVENGAIKEIFTINDGMK